MSAIGAAPAAPFSAALTHAVTFRRFEVALENLTQGVCFFDGEQRLVLANRRYAELYNIPPERLPVGISLRQVIALRIELGSAPNMSAEAYHAWRNAVAVSQEPHSSTVELADGRIIVIKHQPMPDGGWVATHEDVTEQRRTEARIAAMAHADNLTGLANRLAFRSRLEAALEHPEGCGLICLDLDRFKEVNDSFGHPMGDLLLQAVAERLRAETRPTDTVARLGGDEFAIILEPPPTPDDAVAVAERLIAALSCPYSLNGQRVLVGASAGLAFAPSDGTAADPLLSHADTALYCAKAEGRGGVRRFVIDMTLQNQRRQRLEADLFQALFADEFHLVYQPWLSVDDRRPIGVEALIRWDHPERGAIPPDQFIPLAEDLGLIGPIGAWVLRRACADAMRLPPDLRLAVNLSPAQFVLDGLETFVRGALDQSGLDPTRLELEITETAMLQDTSANLEILYRLRSLGIGIAMDDFGTGYSSLAALQRFPFTKVKIDRRFIASLGQSRQSYAIVRATAGLCADLGMATTAEGVETEAQLRALAEIGCTEAQGFLFSRPVPVTELGAVLARLAAGSAERNMPRRGQFRAPIQAA